MPKVLIAPSTLSGIRASFITVLREAGFDLVYPAKPGQMIEEELLRLSLVAFASLNRQGVDLALAEIVLKDLIPDNSGPEITAATIMAATASYYGLSMDDLCGSSRSRTLVRNLLWMSAMLRSLPSMRVPW